MFDDKAIRDLCDSLGIDDDRAEQAIVDLNTDFNTKIQLERDKVSEEVSRLEDALMELKVG